MPVEIITKEDLRQFRLELLEDLKKIFIPPQSLNERKWLRTSEVRKLLKISPGTLQCLRVSGKLHPSRIGSMMYYKIEEINDLLEGNINKKN